MYNEQMYELGAKSSVIREIFEYAKARAAQIGKENIFDFSIGNPSVPAPPEVSEALKRLIDETDPTVLHGYTSAVGDLNARKSIADYLNKTYGTAFNADNFYMTCGAAASLAITLNALCEPEDEVILLAPFFPEYVVFAQKAGFKAVTVRCDEKTLCVDLDALETAINEHTKAIILNSPNNPSGVITDEETVKRLAALLEKKSGEYGRPIFLIADEPYRELIYNGASAPYLTKYYRNTIVCYSFSKSLSLPGERIGYILVPDEAAESKRLYKAVCGAGRALGYVCAPSLMQMLIPHVIGMTSDIGVYSENRRLLLESLEKMGFEAAKPDGAFYLFLKSPEADAAAFCEKAKQFELLLVPSDSFGFPGYVRIAYCVSPEMIKRSLPAFEKFARLYGLC